MSKESIQKTLLDHKTIKEREKDLKTNLLSERKG